MSYTEYVEYKTGETLYAKPKPISATPAWGTDVITMAENAATGEYSAATFADATQYTIYAQVGGSPASSDTKIAVVTPDSANIATISAETIPKANVGIVPG